MFIPVLILIRVAIGLTNKSNYHQFFWSFAPQIRSGVKGQNQQQQQSPSPSKDPQKTLNTSEVDKLFEEFQNSDKRLSSDFKPFAKNPEKQKRYELFLRMKDKGQKGKWILGWTLGCCFLFPVTLLISPKVPTLSKSSLALDQK